MTTEYTANMRQMWGLADYTGLALRLAPAAAMLAERVLPGAGRVLDLAAGTGNVAALVARRGPAVTAADLSPRMVELGRTATAGLPVEWAEADAEDLPFPDAGFDAVLSSFGMIFAPRPAVALAEARRVLAPGGTLALTAWTPEGFVGRMTQVMRRWLPPTEGVADVLDWGREPVLREWLATAGFSAVEVQAAMLPWHFDTPAAMTEFLLAHSPSHRASVQHLGERAPEMLAAVEEVAGEPCRPVRLDAGFVLVTAS